ncbi:hypothetical protein KAS31_03145 [Candidatus Parcubacteria bacterium]|nr:hypothetical protein [Candidatus Parcubacteria bacterium]
MTDSTSQTLVKVMLFILILFFAIGILRASTNWITLIVIFIAIFLLTFIVFGGTGARKIGIAMIFSLLFLTIAIYSGLVNTDLVKDNSNLQKGTILKLVPVNVSGSADPGSDWTRIRGGKEESTYRLISFYDTMFAVSFDYKGNSSASFRMKVWDLNSPTNLMYSYEVVNFSEEGGKYYKRHQKGDYDKDREIAIEIIVPAGATIEITNFTVVGA